MCLPPLLHVHLEIHSRVIKRLSKDRGLLDANFSEYKYTFFYNKASNKRKKNRIDRIQNDDGV